MANKKEAWQYLIDVVFNGKKEVPIEHIVGFRRLAEEHRVDYFCDFLRGIKLPDTLKQDPWEWKYLEDLSKVLPNGVQILVLKGACARDLDLYPIPSLRKSDDLDIFVYGLESYDERKEFIKYLLRENKIRPIEKWELRLKKLNNVIAKHEGSHVDIHFELFSPLGNLYDFGFGLNKRNKTLEKEIINKSLSYRGLENIRKMNYEDYWLYCIFHILKDFPAASLRLILDAFSILDQKKTTFEKLKERSKETNQLFLFNIGKFIISQIDVYKHHCEEERSDDEAISLRNTQRLDSDLNWIYKKTFKIERIQYTNKFSIKNRLIDSFSKSGIAANGSLLLLFIYFIFYLFVGNFVLNDLDENPLSTQAISNTVTKIMYVCTKIRNLLKALCLKAAGIEKSIPDVKVLNTSDKKLITLTILDLKLTFRVPIEFYDDLCRIWKGFVTDKHLSKEIDVEKIDHVKKLMTDPEVVFSNNNVYLRLISGAYGKASINSSGSFFATTFWDVRNFALCIFRAMSFEKDDLVLVHSCAVRIGGVTLIFPGGSSAGKTTIFNILVKNGACGINDDTILLKKENNTWFVHPTPFMSRNQEPLLSEKSKLTRVIDLVKAVGGHEINPLSLDYALALLLNNSQAGFNIDDSGFTMSKLANKVIDLSTQIEHSAKIKYSLEHEEVLLKLIGKWLENPNESYKYGSSILRIIEVRGRSMEPTFKEGQIVTVEEVNPENLKTRDVICFTKDPYSLPLIHRVKYLIRHKAQLAVITRGDGNIYEDEPNIFKPEQKLLRISSIVKVNHYHKSKGNS